MPDLPTATDLARWRALAEAATPGPLSIDPAYMSAWYTLYAPVIGPIADVFGHSDAEFIAAAREAVPRLLDYVAHLERLAVFYSDAHKRAAEEIHERVLELADIRARVERMGR